MYQALLMDHFKNPRNRGRLADGQATFIETVMNHSCGDEIICSAIIDENRIKTILFDGKGCVISQATASLLSEYVISKTIADIQTINIDTIQSLIGICLGPVRIQCALISLQALLNGIAYNRQQM